MNSQVIHTPYPDLYTKYVSRQTGVCVAHTLETPQLVTQAAMTPNRRKNDCVAVIYRLSRSIRHTYNQKKRRRKIHD